MTTTSSDQFIEGSTFEGVWFPRFDSMPDGPKTQSCTKCVCGHMWNAHRFRDAACPNPNYKPIKIKDLS